MLQITPRQRFASDISLGNPEISVVLAVGDAEDTVGHLVRSLVVRMQELDRSFEIIAVNDGCRDNSLAVLKLMGETIPELQILTRDSSGRTFVRGATEARGSIVILIEARRFDAAGSLASLGWALDCLAIGREAIVVRGSFIAARKLPALPAIVRAGGPSPLHERLFERAAAKLGLQVAGSLPKHSPGVLGAVLRFLAA